MNILENVLKRSTAALCMLMCFLVFSAASVWAVGQEESVQKVAQKVPQEHKELFMAAASQERVLKIGLVDCVLYALKGNSDILIKRIEPKLKEEDIKVAQAAFEPTLNAEFTLNGNTEIPSSTLMGTDKYGYQDRNINAGVSGKIATGAVYNLEFLNQKYKSDSLTQTFNPYFATEPKITLTQPLLRGFGTFVNKADISIARNNKLQSQAAFKNTVMEQISKSKTAYYNYVYYLEAYAIAIVSLERGRDLLSINEARYKKGLISSVDLLETEAAAAQREKGVLAAGTLLKRAEDDLKLVTNLVDDPETWNARIELIDKPEFRVEEVDLLQSLKAAFEYRPDYQSAKIDLRNRDIKIKVSENELLPMVDLTGSLGLNGLGKDYQDAIEKMDSDYTDWGVGVKFTLPWGGAERATHDQRNLEKAQALLEVRRLEQNIILDVRDKVRLVQARKQHVDVAKLSMDKEAQNYQAQKERYAAGQVSTHDMLDYQDKVAQTELDYVNALIQYSIAIVNLDNAQGLTLVKNDIKLEE